MPDLYREGYRDGYRDASFKQLQLTEERSKTKRKPTAYQKRYGAAYKKLKKQHPRMSFGSLSKKAHRKARR